MADSYPFQQQSNLTEINNNKRKKKGIQIKVLKPAIIPIPFNALNKINKKNGTNIIYKKKTKTIQKNKNNSMDRIILPKKIFLVENNDIILEKNNNIHKDIQKESIKDNTNKNSIPNIINFEQNNNYDHKYSLPYITNVEKEEEENNHKYSISYITNVEEQKNINDIVINKRSISYKPIVKKQINNSQDVYSLPYITKIEEENKDSNTLPYITKTDEENNIRNNNIYSLPYITKVEEDNYNNIYSPPYITKVEEDNYNNIPSTQYTTNIEVNNNQYVNIKPIPTLHNNKEFAKITKLSTEIINLINNNETIASKISNTNLGSSSSNQSDLNIINSYMTFGKNSKIQSDVNSSMTFGRISSNQSDSNQNVNNNDSNSLGNNNTIEKKILEKNKKLNNIISQNIQLKKEQINLIPIKAEQIGIMIDKGKKDINNKRYNMNKKDIININNCIDKTDRIEINRSPKTKTHNSNISVIDTNKKINIYYIPKAESIEENQIGPRDRERKMNNNHYLNTQNINNNNNRPKLNTHENIIKTFLFRREKEIDNNLFGMPKINKKILAKKKIPLNDFHKAPRTTKSKRFKFVKVMKKSPSDPYFSFNNVIKGNIPEDYGNNLEYNTLPKVKKIQMIKDIRNSNNFNYNNIVYNNHMKNKRNNESVPIRNLDGEYLNNNYHKFVKSDNDIKDWNFDKDLNVNININDIYKENNNNNEKYRDSDELDNNLKKRSLKIEDFNFDNSDSNLNSTENQNSNERNKNNDAMDQYDNDFNNHEKFIIRMRKIFDDLN